ncbi:sulfatase-like hydrolase/transferase [Microbacterium sp. ASV81]|uniref:Sulfatase-like hydrolase/transferase n=1 Tax=Microbacterium capsulatum TaxID=3041921 RepID=A0ABU0XE93_9MICO|nr:sulfatase-like hydrolase/transferase [Microbacterium sp. ASV81]MDQ4213381.1 sulfatase-like hydrolase/transferase [Microbacterium sp. ASV81]
MNRPNVVVIYADDLGYGDVGCFGSDDIRTPHLDRLAARGVRMTNWYSNSPVCSPSRAALLTGRHPVHAGVQEILGGKRGTPGLPAQPTLASRLQEEGYRTGIFGKWHLGVGEGYRPLDRGFERHFGFLAGCVDYYSHIFYWGQGLNPVHDLWDDEREVYDNGRYLTEVLTDKAVAFIADNAADPFFCYVPFNAPHYPMHAPAEYVDRFPELPDDRRIMAAMISAMDDGVGRILDALEEAGIADDTIVFFSSDNGPSTESRNWLNGEEIDYQGGSTGGLRGNKGSLFDGGIRVPAIIAWPSALPQGAEWSEPGAMMDLLPTVLEAAGAPAAADADGTSVLAALRELEPLPEERTLFWEYGPQLAARRGPWKLTLSAREHLGGRFQLGSAMLANLDEDPAEAEDLSAQHPEIAAALRAEVEAWAKTFDWDPAPWL